MLSAKRSMATMRQALCESCDNATLSLSAVFQRRMRLALRKRNGELSIDPKQREGSFSRLSDCPYTGLLVDCAQLIYEGGLSPATAPYGYLRGGSIN